MTNPFDLSVEELQAKVSGSSPSPSSSNPFLLSVDELRSKVTGEETEAAPVVAPVSNIPPNTVPLAASDAFPTGLETGSSEVGETREARPVPDSFPALAEAVREEAYRFAKSYDPASVALDYMGDIASIPSAAYGMKYGQKLAEPIKHPLAKGAVFVTASAIAAGLGQFSGEIAKDAIKGGEVDYRKAMDKAVETAAFDAGGNLVLGGFGKISRKTLGKLRELGKIDNLDAKGVAQKLFEKYGTTMTRYQMTGSTFSKAAELISSLGLDFKGSIKKVTEAQQLALSKELDSLMIDSQSFEGLGRQIIDTHTKSLKTLRAEYEQRQQAVFALAPEGVKVKLKGLKQKVLADIKKSAGAEKVTKAKQPNEIAKQVNDSLTNLKDEATFKELAITISKLAKMGRAAKRTGDEEGAAYVSRYQNLLEDRMGAAADQIGSGYKKELDELRKFYREGTSKLNSQVMRSAVKNKNPSQIGAFLTSSPEAYSDFKVFLNESIKNGSIKRSEVPQLMKEMRSGYVNKLVGDAPTFDDLLALRKKLQKKDKRELTAKILGVSDTKKLQGVLDALDIVKDQVDGNARFGLVAAGQTAQSLKTLGSYVVTLGGAGAAHTAMNPLAALGILVSPTVLGHLASKGKNFRRWKGTIALLDKAQKAGDDELTRIALSRAANLAIDLEIELFPEEQNEDE